ncbi:hypothetical protein D516_3322 [Rhodobacter sp. AKP1]|nr:hypothetical protein D516_3322 [Rhodobacter sp. AKP1]
MGPGDERRVLDVAAVDVGLLQRIGGGEGRGIARPRREGDRPARQDEARQARVRDRHIRQRHVAGVRHREAVAERLADRRGARDAARIHRLDQRDGRGRGHGRHGGRVIGGVRPGLAGHFGGRAAGAGVGAGRQRGILDEAAVEILLLQAVGGGEGGAVAVARREGCDRPAGQHETRKAVVGHGHVGERHVARVRHSEAVGEHVAHRRRRGEAGRVDLLHQGDGGRERERRGHAVLGRDRHPAAALNLNEARHARVVGEAARIDVGLGQLIGRGEARRVRGAACQRDRPARHLHARHRIGERHVGEGGHAAVGHGEAVADGLARQGRRGETAFVGCLHERDRSDLHRRRRVVGDGRAGEVADRHRSAARALRPGAGGGGLVLDTARVDVGGGEQVGGREGGRVRLARQQDRDGQPVEGGGQHRIGQRHIGQRHVAGVGHREAEEDRVSGRDRIGEARGVCRLHHRDGGGIGDIDRRRIVLARVVGIAVPVRVGVRAIVGEIGHGLARELALGIQPRLVPVARRRGIGQGDLGPHLQRKGDGAACPRGEGAARDELGRARAGVAHVQATAAAAGRRDEAIFPRLQGGQVRVVGAEAGQTALKHVGHGQALHRLDAEVAHREGEAHAERAIGLQRRLRGHALGDAHGRDRPHGEVVAGQILVRADRHRADDGRARRGARAACRDQRRQILVAGGEAAGAGDRIGAFGQKAEAIAAARVGGGGPGDRGAGEVGSAQLDGDAPKAGVGPGACAVLVEVAPDRAREGRAGDLDRAAVAVVRRHAVVGVGRDACAVGEALRRARDRRDPDGQGDHRLGSGRERAEGAADRRAAGRAGAARRAGRAGRHRHARCARQHHARGQGVGEDDIVGLGIARVAGVVDHHVEGEILPQRHRGRRGRLARHLHVHPGAQRRVLRRRVVVGAAFEVAGAVGRDGGRVGDRALGLGPHRHLEGTALARGEIGHAADHLTADGACRGRGAAGPVRRGAGLHEAQPRRGKRVGDDHILGRRGAVVRHENAIDRLVAHRHRIDRVGFGDQQVEAGEGHADRSLGRVVGLIGLGRAGGDLGPVDEGRFQQRQKRPHDDRHRLLRAVVDGAEVAHHLIVAARGGAAGRRLRGAAARRGAGRQEHEPRGQRVGDRHVLGLAEAVRHVLRGQHIVQRLADGDGIGVGQLFERDVGPRLDGEARARAVVGRNRVGRRLRDDGRGVGPRARIAARGGHEGDPRAVEAGGADGERVEGAARRDRGRAGRCADAAGTRRREGLDRDAHEAVARARGRAVREAGQRIAEAHVRGLGGAEVGDLDLEGLRLARNGGRGGAFGQADVGGEWRLAHRHVGAARVVARRGVLERAVDGLDASRVAHRPVLQRDRGQHQIRHAAPGRKRRRPVIGPVADEVGGARDGQGRTAPARACHRLDTEARGHRIRHPHGAVEARIAAVRHADPVIEGAAAHGEGRRGRRFGQGEIDEGRLDGHAHRRAVVARERIGGVGGGDRRDVEGRSRIDRAGGNTDLAHGHVLARARGGGRAGAGHGAAALAAGPARVRLNRDEAVGRGQRIRHRHGPAGRVAAIAGRQDEDQFVAHENGARGRARLHDAHVAARGDGRAGSGKVVGGIGIGRLLAHDRDRGGHGRIGCGRHLTGEVEDEAVAHGERARHPAEEGAAGPRAAGGTRHVDDARGNGEFDLERLGRVGSLVLDPHFIMHRAARGHGRIGGQRDRDVGAALDGRGDFLVVVPGQRIGVGDAGEEDEGAFVQRLERHVHDDGCVLGEGGNGAVDEAAHHGAAGRGQVRAEDRVGGDVGLDPRRRGARGARVLHIHLVERHAACRDGEAGRAVELDAPVVVDRILRLSEAGQKPQEGRDEGCTEGRGSGRLTRMSGPHGFVPATRFVWPRRRAPSCAGGEHRLGGTSSRASAGRGGSEIRPADARKAAHRN